MLPHDALTPAVKPPTDIGDHNKAIEACLMELTDKVIEKAHKKIEKEYNPTTGEKPKPYHNLAHTREVEKRMEALLDHPLLETILNSFSPDQWKYLQNYDLNTKPRIIRRLARLMASTHDVVVDNDPVHTNGINETSSGAWVEMEMNGESDHPARPNEMETVKNGILATITRLEGKGTDRYLAQQAPAVNPESIAVDINGLLARMLCDADLGALGSEWNVYWNNTKKLFKETMPTGTLENWKKLLELQIPILKNHAYYTPMAEALWSRIQRERNATQVQTILASGEELQKTYEEVMG